MIARRSFLGGVTSTLGLLALGGAGCRGGGPTALTVRGSDSELNLVQRLAEVFMERRPDVSIGVTGGGSGVGIAALLDGTTDLATSSRALKPQERLLAMRKGRTIAGTIFATDALAVVVHPDNPLTSATLAEIGAWFRPDAGSFAHGAPVVAYGRQSSSGTHGFFKKAVVQADYAPTVREMNGNAQIVEAVSHDPGGVGYVAAGYLRHGAAVKVLAITGDAGAISPLDEEAVLAGRYSITRPLLQFTEGAPRGVAKDFLQFELSAEGEAIVREMGFYPVLAAWRLENEKLLSVTS